MLSNLNRRKHPRIAIACDVKCKISGKNDLMEGYTRDISCGGICLITECSIPQGDEIEFSFDMDELNTISGRGRVVWAESFSIGDQDGWDNGVQFTNISPDDKQFISHFIKSRQSSL
jgi:c-di-GMP-binding flagellar brake protein YcgR